MCVLLPDYFFEWVGLMCSIPKRPRWWKLWAVPGYYGELRRWNAAVAKFRREQESRE